MSKKEYLNSEFIEVQRKAVQLAKNAYEEDQEWCPTKTSRLLDACNRIESLEQQRNDLLAALENFPPKARGQTFEQFYNCCMSWDRTCRQAAIRKAK